MACFLISVMNRCLIARISRIPGIREDLFFGRCILVSLGICLRRPLRCLMVQGFRYEHLLFLNTLLRGLFSVLGPALFLFHKKSTLDHVFSHVALKDGFDLFTLILLSEFGCDHNAPSDMFLIGLLYH